MATYLERQRNNAVKAKTAYQDKVSAYPEIITTLQAMTNNSEAQDLAVSLQRNLDGLPSKIAEIDAFIADLDD